MILCGNCSYELGTRDKFVFLEISNPKTKCYHFALRKNFEGLFSKDKFIIKPDLIKNRYFQVECFKCKFEFAKKIFENFNGKRYSYVAFGKEKLVYDDGLKLHKNDKWIEKVDADPFINYPRFGINAFVDSSSKCSRITSSKGYYILVYQKYIAFNTFPLDFYSYYINIKR